MRGLSVAFTLTALLAAIGCGGGGPSRSTVGKNTITPPGSAANVVAVSVNGGPTTSPQTNLAYVSVTVCAPGTTNCQTIDNISVDTGSEGLRLLSSVMTVSLPQQNDANGNALAECAAFADGYTWGPLQMADVKIGGETASNIPIQVIGGGGAALSSVPASCANSGLVGEGTVDALGANGILGIGPFRQDCGSACTSTDTSVNPGLYYTCPSSGCQTTAATLAQQAQNPVWMFPTDNNGTILELPVVPAGGAATVAGSLVFGIGTQSNNGLGNANLFTLDNQGNFVTVFNGSSYNQSYIDSGSNALFFLDSATTGLPDCTGGNSGFYCPAISQAFSATNQGYNGAVGTVPFAVANTDALNPNFTAFSNLAGPNPNSFDWGLPFFYGRNVFTAIEGQNTAAGVGPFFAY